jgi:hypothetical protein
MYSSQKIILELVKECRVTTICHKGIEKMTSKEIITQLGMGEAILVVIEEEK